MLFSFIKYVLPILQISQRKFSYNFIPAYTRKTTHYKIMELITDEFPQANVIIMNGNGIEFWRKNSLNEIEKISTDYELNNNLSVKEKTKMLEPSYIIQKLIEDYSNFPTFVTGLTCVGMSVTLINQELGNFDNVVFMHNHFTSENLYQLCRFLFNYMSWSEENKRKIKNTKIHSYYKCVYDIISEYEEDVRKMSTEFAGGSYSLREIRGIEEPIKSDKEIKTEELLKITLANKKIWCIKAVLNNDDDEIWEEVKNKYYEIKGKELNGRSMPRKKDGFYHCSTTKNPKKQLRKDIDKIKNHNWWVMLQLVEDTFSYARVFVGYENENNPDEYYIYIKYAIIENNEMNREIINKYAKKEKKTSEIKILNENNEIELEENQIQIE